MVLLPGSETQNYALLYGVVLWTKSWTMSMDLISTSADLILMFMDIFLLNMS